MIDHFTLRVRNLARSRAFYAQALAPLGYRIGHEGTHDGVSMAGFGAEQRGVGFKRDSWFADSVPVSGPAHLCWRAASRAEVDAFHAAGPAAGGLDNGASGLRAHYHPTHYGAFRARPGRQQRRGVCHAAE